MRADAWRAGLARIGAGHQTVRVRASLSAVLVVGIAMVLGAVVLVQVLRDLLADEVANAAQVRADEIAAVLETGVVPVLLPVVDADDELVQIVDAAGAVVAASRNVDGLPPVAHPGPDSPVEIGDVIGEHPLIAVSVTVPTPRGPLTAVVARTLEPVSESTELVTMLLATGLPVLLLLIGVTTWLLVGRSLAPVEAMRREVDLISVSELDRRVPRPPGGDEIARLATTMNRMLERLQGAHQRQRQFVSDASHELRTPVAAIRQHAEVALAFPDRTTTRALATTVLGEDLRIQRLVEDLLLLARADESSVQVRREPVDLDDLVFDEARRLREGTDLRIDTTAVSAARVDGDAAALGRVLLNLGENAARHARSHVSFRLGVWAGQVLLEVIDDGPGIPAGDRERVLERFVRLDEGRARDAGGSGLGLAIVHEVVTAHGGTVGVADGPSGGTRVQLGFPGSSDGS